MRTAARYMSLVLAVHRYWFLAAHTVKNEYGRIVNQRSFSATIIPDTSK